MTDAPRVRQSLETKRDKIWGPHSPQLKSSQDHRTLSGS